MSAVVLDRPLPEADPAGLSVARSADAARRPAAGPLWAASVYAAVVAGTLGWFVAGLPVQVSDSFGDILKLSASWSELLQAQSTQQGFLRPLHWAALKAVYDLSGGDYFAWFRGVHVAQVGVLIALFMVLARPRTWLEAATLPLGLAVLAGLHTFSGTVREAFPINLYLTVAICCLGAAVLVLARHRWWNDPLVLLAFAAATLTLETGLLVWVIAVGGALLGARGISRPGLVVLTAALAGYFYLRFAVLGVGSPGLLERASGFGFAILEPDALVARFDDSPALFYVYNIAASALSVLASEPTGGVFVTTRALVQGTMSPMAAANLVSSAGACALLAAYAWARRRHWRHGAFDRRDRLVMLFGMVLAANAAISYPYTKDVIMSPSGAFLGLAVHAAAMGLAERYAPIATPRVAALAAVLAAAVGLAWAFRVEHLYSTLRQGAVVERLSWAYVDSDVARGEVTVEGDRARAMLTRLQHDALVVHPAPVPLQLPLAQLAEGDD